MRTYLRVINVKKIVNFGLTSFYRNPTQIIPRVHFKNYLNWRYVPIPVFLLRAQSTREMLKVRTKMSRFDSWLCRRTSQWARGWQFLSFNPPTTIDMSFCCLLADCKRQMDLITQKGPKSHSPLPNFIEQFIFLRVDGNYLRVFKKFGDFPSLEAYSKFLKYSKESLPLFFCKKTKLRIIRLNLTMVNVTLSLSAYRGLNSGIVRKLADCCFSDVRAHEFELRISKKGISIFKFTGCKKNPFQKRGGSEMSRLKVLSILCSYSAWIRSKPVHYDAFLSWEGGQQDHILQ